MAVRRTLSLFVLAFAATFATRWPLRTEHLFSWDSANYALATTHIDIAAHQPHPPGYLGYVFAARALERLTRNVNEALVLWNILASAAALFILLRFVDEVLTDDRGRAIGMAAAGLGMLTSPLFWFYGEAAEIYPSELLATLAVAYAGHRAIRGSTRALPWCLVLLSVAALFKLSAALLISPYVSYAAARAPRASRVPAAVAGLVAATAVAAVFLFYQPDLLAVIWRQFTAATDSSRLIAGHTSSSLRSFNRNARTTLMAAVSALGLVNLGMLAVWLATVRRKRAGTGWMVALWAGPWVVLVLFVHIAKPGYVLPILPAALLAIAPTYASMRRGPAVLAVTAMAAINVAQFLCLTPPTDAAIGRDLPYRSKTLAQRVVSDLEPLAFPTLSTLRASDRAVAVLLERAPRGCPVGEPLIIADSDPVDWRRVMWYLPEATAIYAPEGKVAFTAYHRKVTSVFTESAPRSTQCPILWLWSSSRAPSGLPPSAVAVPGLGYEIPPQAVRVGPTGVRFGS